MAQETLKIESQDVTIEALYKDFYTVPDFQREYVWGRNQVEKLLQDVYDEFYDEDGQQVFGPEYFLGSIVVCYDNGAYSLIDGQQRMTTIYLFLCALRDLLTELNETPNQTLINQIHASHTNDQGEEEFRQRLVLQYEDSKGVVSHLVNTPSEVDSISDQTESVKRIVSAYREILEFLRVNLDGSPQRVRKFYATFTKRVKLIRITTPSLANALKVFETVNDRGVGLNAMDLLKNLLFMRTSQSDYPTLKQRWKDLMGSLEQSGEKPLRFLRYFVMSHFEQDSNQPLREDEIYDWFTRNSAMVGIDTDPLGFLSTLNECAEAWYHFLNSRDADGTANPYLKNLTLLSGAARQHFVLLLAGRHLERQQFTRLCKAIENLFFCYIITREPTRTFERNFATWATDLRAVETQTQLDAFIDARINSDLARRRSAFDFAFAGLTQSRVQKYRMRYILAKLTQYIELQAWNNAAHASLDQYIDPNVDVEHILPQKPTPEVRIAFDKSEQYDDYVERLGNLTLLEKTINTSVSNGFYTEKMPGYQESNYLLTRSLVEKPHVGANTQLNRAVKDLPQFDDWNSVAIERRQSMLVELAAFVWGMPVAEDS